MQFTIFSVQQPFKPIQRRLLRIPALPRCHSHSPDEQILLLGCVDASVIAWDVTKDTTVTYKASFVSVCPFTLLKQTRERVTQCVTCWLVIDRITSLPSLSSYADTVSLVVARRQLFLHRVRRTGPVAVLGQGLESSITPVTSRNGRIARPSPAAVPQTPAIRFGIEMVIFAGNVESFEATTSGQ